MISNPPYAFLINGKISNWFIGNPSGLVVHYLNFVRRDFVQSGNFVALHLSPDLAPITHFFFADDVALVKAIVGCSGKWSCSRMSGQSVNLVKSKMVVSRRVRLDVVEAIPNLEVALEWEFS